MAKTVPSLTQNSPKSAFYVPFLDGPARYQVLVTVRPKSACPKGRTGVVQAKAPPHLLEGSWPTEALLAQIAVSKHSEHMLGNV